MHPKYNKELVPFAKELRKDMTKQEKHLWYDYLRTYPVKFTRQKVLGYYIADFYCAQARLVIELDGLYHTFPENGMQDVKRDDFISRYGVTVIRITDQMIDEEFEKVCGYIDSLVRERLRRDT